MQNSSYEIFVKAAEIGSLTAAAEQIGCTQSNASHAINALEKECGFPLMLRGRFGIRLTPEGERLLPALKAICEAEDRLQREISEMQRLQSGTIRLGSFTSVAVHWLPEILKGFGELYPNITFELLSGDYSDTDAWLQSGRVDAAFTRLPSDLPCTFLPLYEDPLQVILPQDHPKAHYTGFPIAEIADEPFISLLESSAHDSVRLLKEAGITPNVRFTTKDDYALIAMVAGGLGISIVPELLLSDRSERIVSVPLDPPASRTIALAIPKGSAASPVTHRFAEFVAEWMKSTQTAN